MTEQWGLGEWVVAFFATFVVCAALIEAGMWAWDKWRGGK